MSYVMELRELLGSRPLLLPGAVALLLDQERRLLLQLRRVNGMWGPPGGMLEVGESLEECVVREMLEETGLALKKFTLFGVFSGPAHQYLHPTGDQICNVTVAYEVNDYDGELEIKDAESLELKFFPLDSIPDNLSPQDKPIIDKFLDSLNSLAR